MRINRTALHIGFDAGLIACVAILSIELYSKRDRDHVEMFHLSDKEKDAQNEHLLKLMGLKQWAMRGAGGLQHIVGHPTSKYPQLFSLADRRSDRRAMWQVQTYHFITEQGPYAELAVRDDKIVSAKVHWGEW